MEKENSQPNALNFYNFLPATEADLETLTDFCATHFPRLEPHNKALRIDGKVARPLFRYVLATSLQFPYSIKVIEKSSGRIIGLKTMSVVHRDSSLNLKPYELDTSNIAANSLKLAELCVLTDKILWEAADPTVTKMLSRDLSMVLPEHSRRGIARHIAELGLDFEKLREEGFHGICSQAFSMANQKLLFSMGFKCVAIPEYDWKDKLTDGTETVMAMFKDFRV